MSDVRWEGYSHEEIYAQVQQGPGRLASSDAEAAWSTVESTIRTVDAQLTRAVNRIGAGWQGRAADAVHGGMTVMIVPVSGGPDMPGVSMTWQPTETGEPGM